MVATLRIHPEVKIIVILEEECLTTDLDNKGSLVLKALHLHAHFVDARVFSVGLADEEDAVVVAVTYVHSLGLQRLAVLGPGHSW